MSMKIPAANTIPILSCHNATLTDRELKELLQTDWELNKLFSVEPGVLHEALKSPRLRGWQGGFYQGGVI